MEEKEFVNKVFAKFSNEGFVQSYRSQLRLGIHKFSTANRNFSYEPFRHSLRTELICNIIADYFEKYAYKNSMNVFLEESGFHKMKDSDILRLSHLSESKTTFLESLMETRKRITGRRNTETQTNNESLEEKLSKIETRIQQRKSAVRAADRRRMVEKRLNDMRQEKEVELQKRLQYTYDSQVTVEKSKARMDQAEKFRLDVESLKAQYDAMFLKKSAEFRVAREQEEESTKMLQEELDRQLQRLKAGYENKPTSLTTDQATVQSQKKLKKLLSKAQKLVKKRENVKQQLKKEQEAHKQTIKELTALQHKFASLNVK